MTMPLTVFSALVLGALAITTAAPVLLLVLLIRDWKSGEERLQGVATVLTRLVRLAEAGDQEAA